MGKRFTIALALFALLVVPLGAYVGGYFWLGRRREFRSASEEVIPELRGKSYGISRTYNKKWQATVYRPAAVVESWLTGYYVETNMPTH